MSSARVTEGVVFGWTVKRAEGADEENRPANALDLINVPV
jgi:hypothetical protein